jgi:hypothetical protein
MKHRVIFVFGSNLAGRHGIGSAHEAYAHHGAKWGQGVGLQGESYAIPTKDYDLKVLSLDHIKHHIDEFLQFAREHRDWIFSLVAIGCGAAGYGPEQIAPMFQNAPQNCLLPLEFIKVLRSQKSIEPSRILHFGYRKRNAKDLLEVIVKSDKSYVLADVRISVSSPKYPYWSETNLRKLYPNQYVWVKSLGNENRFKEGEPMKLANPSQGIKYLLRLLTLQRIPILLCACEHVEVCHRQLIIDELHKIDPSIIIEEANLQHIKQHLDMSHCNQD